jgi:hypothetical protein
MLLELAGGQVGVLLAGGAGVVLGVEVVVVAGAGAAVDCVVVLVVAVVVGAVAAGGAALADCAPRAAPAPSPLFSALDIASVLARRVNRERQPASVR